MQPPKTTNEKAATGRLTRRELAATLAGGSLMAQNPSAPLQQNPDEELRAARDQNRQSIAQLEKFPLPTATEPATHFKA